jgi:hypothetical protein
MLLVKFALGASEWYEKIILNYYTNAEDYLREELQRRNETIPNLEEKLKLKDWKEIK